MHHLSYLCSRVTHNSVIQLTSFQIAGAVTTYLIILVQFQLSSKTVLQSCGTGEEREEITLQSLVNNISETLAQSSTIS